MNPASISDPTSPGAFHRKLPTSLDKSFSAPESAATRAPAGDVFTRPIAPVAFRPANRTPVITASMTPFKVFESNPFRQAVMLRLRDGDATSVYGLVDPTFKLGQDNYVPITNDEVIFLESAGEVWVAWISGTTARIYSAEQLSPKAQ